MPVGIDVELNELYATSKNMRNLKRSTRTLSRSTQLISIILITVVITVIWYANSQTGLLNLVNTPRKIDYVEKFSNKLLKYEKFKDLCYSGGDPKSIEDLSPFVNLLGKSKEIFCLDQFKLFNDVYQIRQKYTTISISSEFMVKVKKWLKNDATMIEATKNQSVIFVDNRYSQESVVFNPVRANRPGTGAGNTKEYVTNLIKESSKDCDFCNYKSSTAADSFGHMESKHSVIISNTFKIEKYHGMALLRSHDPVHFKQVEYIDAIHLALKWFQYTHSLVPSHSYRIMYWDILPKASASQIHPHFHLTLGDYAYYSKWNILYNAGLKFSTHHQHKNYWKNVLQIHESLGLTVTFGQASAMAYLTPQKDFEVFVIAEKPCIDFFRLVFFTLRTFIDNMEQYSLSMGYVFPRIGTDYNYGDELPMMVRIVSRGPADSSRSDISSFDLFGTANVNKDPFKVIKFLRQSVRVMEKEPFTYSNDWENFI